MRIGTLSDVHCNVPAFERALAELSTSADDVFLLGDLMFEYRLCRDMVAIARESGYRYVLGNHELGWLKRPVKPETSDAERADLDFLRAQPLRIDVELGGKKFCVVHASPFPPYNDYLFTGSPLLKQCVDLDADFLLLGHTHATMVERHGGTLVVNPGSLGEPRGANQFTVSYAIIDTETEHVELCRFPNPLTSADAPTEIEIVDGSRL